MSSASSNHTIVGKEGDVLFGVSVAELVVYSIVMLAILHNIYRYLILQGRFKVFTLLTFYICASTLVLSRVMMLGYISKASNAD
jgi:hypothetical protein